LVTFSIESLALTTTTCVAILETKTTNSVSSNTASTDGFKDWQDEEGKPVIITKILFRLFDESIKTAFYQEDEKFNPLITGNFQYPVKVASSNTRFASATTT
jgi:hypothetical protein